MMVRYWKIRKPAILLASIAGGATCNSLPSNQDGRIAGIRRYRTICEYELNKGIDKKGYWTL